MNILSLINIDMMKLLSSPSTQEKDKIQWLQVFLTLKRDTDLTEEQLKS
jgi:hypothetical protein